MRRVYDDPSPQDGYRVLVDRLWPRGLTKERADIDLWLGDVAPSPELRIWWHHDSGRMAEFAERYRAELAENDALTDLRTAGAVHHVVTLLFAARDPEVSHAKVLLEVLTEDA